MPVAARAAEDRSRELHPDAMGRHSPLRLRRTAGPDEVGPLIGRAPPARRGPGGAGETASVPPTAPPDERYAPVVREVLQAELADQVIHEKAWPALAGALTRAEQLGARDADLRLTATGSGS